MNRHTSDHRARIFIYAPPLTPFLDVVHHDDDLLVLNKPSGLLSVPGKAETHRDCLEARARERYPDARIVHRLDNATSGVIVLAMNKKAHRHLSMQFERRHTAKTYIARVWGHVAGDSGRIDLPLICDWPNRPMQMVDFERGKPSQTDWRVLEREGECSFNSATVDPPEGALAPCNDAVVSAMPGPPVTRLELTPLTGRSHQLRVHLLALGHPILGDRFYAPDDALIAADRLQLHAHTLNVRRPADGEPVTFKVPCPF